jgi:tRNA threonylcarbamoyladenosine biosynthesis protein TsaE
MNIRVKNKGELNAAASELLKFAENVKTFLFEGDMGAGKTTLIKSLCSELGMKEMASSPTYSIVNEYEYTNGKIYHFDFFRIRTQNEAFDIGFEEYLASGEFCFIEWPQKISDLWPQQYLLITISEVESGLRNIEVSKI